MGPAGWDSGRMDLRQDGLRQDGVRQDGIRQDGLPEVMSEQGSQLTAFDNSIEIDLLNWEQALKLTFKHMLLERHQP